MPKPYRSDPGGAHQPQVYESSEVRAVMAACEPTPSGHRDRVAIMLMWVAGLKPGEVCSIRPEAVDARKGTIDIGRKGSSEARIVMIPKAQQQELFSLIRKWRRHRDRVAKLPDRSGRGGSPLICSLQGKRLDDAYLRRALPRLAKKAGVKRRFHAHGLRQTFAAAMYMADVPVEMIRRQLGHGDIAFTVSYLERICPRKVFHAMESFSLE